MVEVVIPKGFSPVNYVPTFAPWPEYTDWVALWLSILYSRQFDQSYGGNTFVDVSSNFPDEVFEKISDLLTVKAKDRKWERGDGGYHLRDDVMAAPRTSYRLRDKPVINAVAELAVSQPWIVAEVVEARPAMAQYRPPQSSGEPQPRKAKGKRNPDWMYLDDLAKKMGTTGPALRKVLLANGLLEKYKKTGGHYHLPSGPAIRARFAYQSKRDRGMRVTWWWSFNKVRGAVEAGEQFVDGER